MIKTSRLLMYLFILVFSLQSCKMDNAIPATASQTEIHTFKDLSAFPIGGGIDINDVLSDSKLHKITDENFNSLTSTNDMKIYTIAKKEGEYNWKNADKFVDFCENHDARIFGHALVWHYGLPEWIIDNAEQNPDWTESFLKTYITDVVTRYKGKVSAWDVVNEAIDEAGTNEANYRETFWYNKIGPDYIEKAFKYAHAADPKALLFYNDYDIERDTLKMNATLEMIQQLKSTGTPIHGLGLQMHMSMDIPDETIALCLKKAASTGLQIHISELDMIFNKRGEENKGEIQLVDEMTDELLQAQAEKYKNLVLMYRKIIPESQQFGITFWDFNDRDTWIKSFFKIDDWPTVFDENLDPKPAYYGFGEGLKAKL